MLLLRFMCFCSFLGCVLPCFEVFWSLNHLQVFFNHISCLLLWRMSFLKTEQKDWTVLGNIYITAEQPFCHTACKHGGQGKFITNKTTCNKNVQILMSTVVYKVHRHTQCFITNVGTRSALYSTVPATTYSSTYINRELMLRLWSW